MSHTTFLQKITRLSLCMLVLALAAVSCADTDTPAPPEPAAPAETPLAQEPTPLEGTAPAETPEPEPETPPTTSAAPEPETPPSTVPAPSGECPEGEHPDDSGGCHPNHDDAAATTAPTTTEPPTTTVPEPTTPPESESATTTSAAPEPETPPSTVPAPSGECPEGEHPDDSGGCHPNHDDAAATTAPTTTVPEPTTPPESEPAPTTAAPEPEGPELDESTHLDLSPYSPGQIVPAAELWPDSDFPADFVCQIYPDGDIDDDDGNFNCWRTSQFEEWTPPAAGVVPEVVSLCSTDRATWGDGTCTPPGTWITNTYSPSSMSHEVPRVVAGLVEFLDACSAVVAAPCRGMLARMKWPIDYLGARPSCVVGEYTRRLEHFAKTGDFIVSAPERFGWHNCVTAIDPPAPGAALTDGGNDIGRRLSDTGVTLAERCRLVLPDDVILETKFTRPFMRFEAGHAGCDAWAAWIEDGILDPRGGVSKMPECWRSVNLAQEWMEYHSGVPENYFGFFGC